MQASTAHEILPPPERRDELFGLAVGGGQGECGNGCGRDAGSATLHGSDGIGTLAEVRFFLRFELGLRVASRRSDVPFLDRESDQK